jgi:hypothetical protein
MAGFVEGVDRGPHAKCAIAARVRTRPGPVAAQCPAAACPQLLKADTASAAQPLVTDRNLPWPRTRSHSRRAFVQRGSASECRRRLALAPGRGSVLSLADLEAPRQGALRRSWRGLGRRPAWTGIALETACWPVCRSRRWCPTERLFRALVLSRGPCPPPAKGDIRLLERWTAFGRLAEATAQRQQGCANS